MFSLRQWAYNCWIVLDQALNSLTGGAPDETLSSRLGRLKDDPTKPIRQRLARIICAILDIFDPGHCDRTEQGEKDSPHRPESLDDKSGD